MPLDVCEFFLVDLLFVVFQSLPLSHSLLSLSLYFDAACAFALNLFFRCPFFFPVSALFFSFLEERAGARESGIGGTLFGFSLANSLVLFSLFP